jgi:hypothetical protein
MESKVQRAVTDLRADLARHEGGLVRVFADQLEAVLDALEGAPVVEPEPEVVESFDDLFKDANGLWLLGLMVKTTKKVHAYPSLEIGTKGMVTGYNHNSSYIYRVQVADFATVSLARDEVTLNGE